MSFPPSILERAADHKLGEPVRAFDGRASLRPALVWTGLFGLAGLLLIPSALVLLALGRTAAGLVVALLAVVHAIAVARLVRHGGVLVGPSGLRAHKKIVYLFGGGLVLDAQGERAVHLWDDLSSVTVSGVRDAARSPTRYRFTVTTAGGREITLGPELPDVRELGERVAAEVTSRVLPDRLARIRSGRPVEMGPFTLSLAGVEKEGERLSWGDVVDVGVDNGVVFVGTRGEARRLSAIAARMPNAIAFVQVCRTLAEGEDTVQRR